MDSKIVWLVVHYDYGDSDVIAICTTCTKAHEIRKKYLKLIVGNNYKSVNVIKFPLDMISTIYE